jgi:hypothetical protein
MWENNLEAKRPQVTIWCMRIACWIRQAINKHLEYETHFLLCNNGCAKAPVLLYLDYLQICYLLLLFEIVYFRFNSLREAVKSENMPHFLDLTAAVDHIDE